MRVLHLYKTYFPDSQGGVEQVIQNLAASTAPFGVQSSLLACSSQVSDITQDHRPNLSVTRYPTTIEIASCPFSYALAKHFRAEIQKADVLHYHFPWPFADLLQLSLSARVTKPSIVTYHSDVVRQRFLNRFYTPIAKRFLQSVNQIVVGSTPLKDSSPLLKPFQAKTTVIPFGITESAYPIPTPSRVTYWQNRFGKRFLLFIGVLRSYKGLPILLEALQNTDITMVIAGEGPCKQALQQQAETLDLKQIHFLGSVSETDKVDLLAAAYGLVLPSHQRSEAFGMVLVEGLLSGKPLISTELGTGTSFVNQHGKTGYVVPAGNAHALRIAMQTLLALDATDYDQLSDNARKRYHTHFTSETMGAQYAKLYQHLIQRLPATATHG